MRKILLYMMTVTMMTMSLGVETPMVSWAQMENVSTADSENSEGSVVTGSAEKDGEESGSDSTEDSEEEDDEKETVLESDGIEDIETKEREELVNYALQFVGGSYRKGGNDPHTGVDCSGFIRYVMANGAGISMYRSSGEQATQGVSISADEMQPGDLLFYSNGSRINHVAMYIGDGRVVHASTEKTGIKTSIWNYRTPVRIVSMFG